MNILGKIATKNNLNFYLVESDDAYKSRYLMQTSEELPIGEMVEHRFRDFKRQYLCSLWQEYYRFLTPTADWIPEATENDKMYLVGLLSVACDDTLPEEDTFVGKWFYENLFDIGKLNVSQRKTTHFHPN